MAFERGELAIGTEDSLREASAAAMYALRLLTDKI
jgi:hypothetical protein